MNLKKATLHCDYFKFSVPAELTIKEINNICSDLLGEAFNRFDKLHCGREGYKEAYSFANIITIYRYGFLNNKGTTVFELSGQAMKLPAIDLRKLCQFVVSNNGNVCRFDIAADDHYSIIPYREMVDLSTIENFKIRVKTKLCRNRKDRDGNIVDGYPTIKLQPEQIQYGLPSSDNYITVYRHDGVLRVELRLTHRQDCFALAEAIAAGEPEGVLFAGILRKKLDFLQPEGKRKDRNSSMQWWDDFLAGIAARKLVRRKRDKSANSMLFQPSKLQRAYRIANQLEEAGDVKSVDLLAEFLNRKKELRKIAT